MSTPEQTIGRQQELTAVSHFLGEVAKDGAALVVAGQTGVGKSHLLRAATAAARARGIPVHTSLGVAHEQALPFAGLNQLLLPLRSEFKHLSAPQRDLLEDALGLGSGVRDDGAIDADSVAEAVICLMDWLGTTERILLTIDDLHWLDPSSRSVVSAVSRSVAATRAGLLMSICTDSPTEFGPTGVPTCNVSPLDGDAALDLLSAAFPTIAGPLLGRVLLEAQGYPLLLCELPKLLDPSSQHLGTPPPDVLPINSRLSNVFGPRLSALPASTRGVLLLAAMDVDHTAGGPTSPMELESSELDCLAPATAAGLVDVGERTRRVTFCHPLVRISVTALSTSAERRDAHRALSERHSSSDIRMRHLAQVTLEPDEHLASELEKVAGWRERRGDGLGAIQDLQSAADLTPCNAERARRLVAAASVEAGMTGDLINAGRLMNEARTIDPRAGESLKAAITRAMVLLHVAGDVDGAHTVLVAGIKTHAHCVEPASDQVTCALHLLADICTYSGRPELSRPLLDELARLGNDAPPVLTVLTGFMGSSDSLGPARLRAVQGGVQSITKVADPGAIGRTVTAALLTDQLHSVRSTLQKAVRSGRAGGPCSPMVKSLAALAADSYSAGRWDESTSIAIEGETYSDQNDYLLASRDFQLDRALIAAARGRDDVVRSLTTTVDRWATPRGALMLQLRCRRILALSALGRGEFEEAYRHASAVRPLGRAPGSPLLALEVTLDFAEAAVRTNRHAEAADHLRFIESSDITALSPRMEMIASASAGLAAEEGAYHHFDSALAVRGIEQWPFDVARVQLYYGERLRRTRAPAEARRHLDAALGTFTRLGAVPWAERATKERDATAITKRGSMDAFGPSSLTPQEREVAMLAAAGLTNRDIATQLFISHRTVGAHLNHIFPKLGITTRASLRDALQADSVARF